MIYQDKYGRYHDRPLRFEGDFPCNNAWLYTAFAKKLGLKLPVLLPAIVDSLIYIGHGRWSYTRHPWFNPAKPEDQTPPISRDEILGLAYLCKDTSKQVASNPRWNFAPYELPKFNPLTLIKQLAGLVGKHRNTLWQERPRFDQVYWLAFMVPIQDRAFILRCAGLEVPWFYRLVEWADKKRKPKDQSATFIRWLKYDTGVHYVDWEDTFGAWHPFTITFARQQEDRT